MGQGQQPSQDGWGSCYPRAAAGVWFFRFPCGSRGRAPDSAPSSTSTPRQLGCALTRASLTRLSDAPLPAVPSRCGSGSWLGLGHGACSSLRVGLPMSCSPGSGLDVGQRAEGLPLPTRVPSWPCNCSPLGLQPRPGHLVDPCSPPKPLRPHLVWGCGGCRARPVGWCSVSVQQRGAPGKE